MKLGLNRKSAAALCLAVSAATPAFAGQLSASGSSTLSAPSEFISVRFDVSVGCAAQANQALDSVNTAVNELKSELTKLIHTSQENVMASATTSYYQEPNQYPGPCQKGGYQVSGAVAIRIAVKDQPSAVKTYHTLQEVGRKISAGSVGGSVKVTQGGPQGSLSPATTAALRARARQLAAESFNADLDSKLSQCSLAIGDISDSSPQWNSDGNAYRPEAAAARSLPSSDGGGGSSFAPVEFELAEISVTESLSATITFRVPNSDAASFVRCNHFPPPARLP